MPLDSQAYRERGRAESFGAVAANYDRFRPTYPVELIDDLVATHPKGLLDIGCGTGKAAQLFTERGVAVLGVEVDPKMADVARAHGLRVDVSSFEQWDDRGATFDLITAAQAWHWVDPAVGAPKAARLLNPDGQLALFWNFDELGADDQAMIDGVYERLAPELAHSVVTAGERRSRAPYLADLDASGAFGAVTTRTYRSQHEYAVDDWLGMIGTHSDHLALGPARLAELTAGLRAVLTPPIRVTGGTYTILARGPRGTDQVG